MSSILNTICDYGIFIALLVMFVALFGSLFVIVVYVIMFLAKATTYINDYFDKK